MSQERGGGIPPELAEDLRKNPPRLNAVPLISVDGEGFPHVALLSYFELLLQGRHLFFFLHASSRTTRFLRQRGLCTLLFVNRDYVYYIKGKARWIGEHLAQALFELQIKTVLEDFPTAEEGEVWLERGIRFNTPPENIQQRVEFRQKMADYVSTLAR